MAAQRAFRFASIAEGNNVGPETIQQLFEEVQRISSLYPRVPLHQVLGDLIEAQNVSFVILEGRQRPTQTRDLYLLSGILSLMLAKASHDLNDPQSAMKQARTAYICADNAEHDGLRLRVRTQQSLMAYWAGWTSEAIRYADLARDLATPRTGSAGVWLLAQSARTASAVGEGEKAIADLRSARELREQIEPDDLDSFGGLMRFAPCRQQYYAAETLIWIPGQESEAEAASLKAIQTYEEASSSESDDWAFGDEAGSRTDLAFARAARGELEGAEEAISPVLELPVEQRVAGVVASAMRVHGVLRSAQYAGNRRAGQVRQAIESYSRTPAASITSGR